jgi:hypothetical protein
LETGSRPAVNAGARQEFREKILKLWYVFQWLRC